MLDVQLLRNELDAVAQRLAARGGYQLDVDSFRKLEERRKALQSDTESLQAQRNALSKQIGTAKRNKDQQTAESLMPHVNTILGAGHVYIVLILRLDGIVLCAR